MAFRALPPWIANASIKQSPLASMRFNCQPISYATLAAVLRRPQDSNRRTSPQALYLHVPLCRSRAATKWLTSGTAEPGLSAENNPPSVQYTAATRMVFLGSICGSIFPQNRYTLIIDAPNAHRILRFFKHAHTVSSNKPQYAASWRTSLARLRIWAATFVAMARQAYTDIDHSRGRNRITKQRLTHACRTKY